MKKIKVAVLCSGGVDSAVTLHYLKHSGYDVEAFYLKIWLEDELSYLGSCPWEEDFSYVSKTAQNIGVPCYQLPFQKEYWQLVVDKSIDMIKKGLTPNPDVFCNGMIKFGAFYNYFKNDFDCMATGHYATLLHGNDWTYLKMCTDHIKDQTYFLAGVESHCFSRVLFPLQNFKNKQEVRSYASRHKLPSAQRKDSQGICFLGKFSFSSFLQYHCGKKVGYLINYETKKIEGQHNGFWFFTVGQRQGIGLSGGPWYVVDKNIEENIVYISKTKLEHNANLFPLEILVNHMNWLVPSTDYPLVNDEIIVKIRHGEKFNRILVKDIDFKKKTILVKVLFSDQGIASGQFMVFYRADGVVLGGGIMQRIMSHSEII